VATRRMKVFWFFCAGLAVFKKERASFWKKK
jgi:hypothetical protein